MGGKRGFYPDWIEEAPKPGSYRSIFKWGDPNGFKHPNRRLYALMKKEFGLSDDYFRERKSDGQEAVSLPGKAPAIDETHVRFFESVSGPENVSSTDYDRLKYSTGKTMEEILELRHRIVREVTDLVVHPRNKEEVAKIVTYCNTHEIPVYVYGGGSTVNFGYRPMLGGITLVLCTHMNKVVRINEINKTCTVQAGMLGPAYEDELNHAVERHGTKRNYTCGHFPQSFEYSSVGGWIVTWGSGQNSSYFGDACDLVIGMEWVTPAGSFRTHEYPATATGPRLVDIMKGSEGTFGVLVEATLKIFYHQPRNRFRFSYVFPSWQAGLDAVREISQGEFGFPGVFRLSDPEETGIALKLYGVEGTPIDTAMRIAGFKDGKRTLFLGTTEGERGFARNVRRKVSRICWKHGGMTLPGYPARKWEHSRFTDPYMREDLDDYGIMLDTIETAVTWENLPKVHEEVRKYIKARPKTACMTHASHFYPNGTNLYFIYFCQLEDVEEYVKLQSGVFDAIVRGGGSLSHHHGVGRMIAPWMEEHLGPVQMDVLRALKRHFDPKNIMNPGGQLGLDYGPSGIEGKNWRIDWRKKLKR